MSSRDKILGRIRSALNVAPVQAVLPDVPTVWPVNDRSRDELFREFETSLAAVGGETVACRSKEEAAERISVLLKEIAVQESSQAVSAVSAVLLPGLPAIGISDRTIVTETLACADAFRDGASDFQRFYAPEVSGDVSPQEVATFDASIIGAEYLLADTGSAVVASANVFDRMLCYLPPVCCVLATKRMLREHLPSAWPEICRRMKGEPTPEGALHPATCPDADPNVPIHQLGEFLIVTGPSRTADIEKILVMGVHGPKRLIVFVVGE